MGGRVGIAVSLTCSQGPLPGINGRMLCTDSLEDLAVHPPCTVLGEYPHRISTSYDLAISSREVFDLNRCLWLSFCPQDMRNFTENCDARLAPLAQPVAASSTRSPATFRHEPSQAAIHHESRERSGNIHRDVSPLPDSGSNIYAVFLQSLEEGDSDVTRSRPRQPHYRRCRAVPMKLRKAQIQKTASSEQKQPRGSETISLFLMQAKGNYPFSAVAFEDFAHPYALGEIVSQTIPY